MRPPVSYRLGDAEKDALGADHFDRRSTAVKANRLVTQLTKLGFQVQLQLIAEAA